METTRTRRRARALTPAENRVINSQKPARNKSMQAARRLKGNIIVYDPQYKI